MQEPKDLSDQQMVFLDPTLLDRGRIQAGLSLGDLAQKAEIDYRTVRAVYRHGGLLPSKAKDIADTLGCDVLELLAPWDPRYIPPTGASSWLGQAEWERLKHREQGRQAANGLYFIVCQMRHRHTSGRLGRGKYYVLSWLREELKSGIQHKLSRHAEVCALVGPHAHVATNLSSTPTAGDDGWWVVDEWVGERSLADLLESGTLPLEMLPRLLHEVALGLAALHQVGIVFRELAPARVLIADRDNRCVLTDFELAKLTEGVPSVSGDWPEDPFRAPEVDGGQVTAAADIYSFGKLAVSAIAGNTSGPEDAGKLLSNTRMPKRLAGLIQKSLSPLPADRPQNLQPLLKELERWVRQ